MPNYPKFKSGLGNNMNKKIIVLFTCLSLLFALTNTAKTQSQTNNMETFFDSKIPGLKVQVNATSRTQPTSYISAALSLKSEVSTVYIKTVRITVYGFINGTEKIEIYNNVSGDTLLYKANQVVYLHQVFVPEQTYGVTYGEIYLDYNATVKDELGIEHSYSFQERLGFTMTRVENVYLKSLEEQIASLEDQLRDVYSAIDELNQTFRDCFGKNLTRDELLNLNQTLWQFRQDYEALKGVKGELDNTRTAVVFLAVVAVFFVATTAYLVFRKPKDYL